MEKKSRKNHIVGEDVVDISKHLKRLSKSTGTRSINGFEHEFYVCRSKGVVHIPPDDLFFSI